MFVYLHVCKEELYWFEMCFIRMILCVRCTQIEFEGVETVCGLNFGSPGSPHVAQPPYMTELTWLTIESCYHIQEQEWCKVTAMWTVTHFETLVRLQCTVSVRHCWY
jgi:hypothetical protein